MQNSSLPFSELGWTNKIQSQLERAVTLEKQADSAGIRAGDSSIDSTFRSAVTALSSAVIELRTAIQTVSSAAATAESRLLTSRPFCRMCSRKVS